MRLLLEEGLHPARTFHRPLARSHGTAPTLLDPDSARSGATPDLNLRTPAASADTARRRRAGSPPQGHRWNITRTCWRRRRAASSRPRSCSRRAIVATTRLVRARSISSSAAIARRRRQRGRTRGARSLCVRSSRAASRVRLSSSSKATVLGRAATHRTSAKGHVYRSGVRLRAGEPGETRRGRAPSWAARPGGDGTTRSTGWNSLRHRGRRGALLDEGLGRAAELSVRATPLTFRSPSIAALRVDAAPPNALSSSHFPSGAREAASFSSSSGNWLMGGDQRGFGERVGVGVAGSGSASSLMPSSPPSHVSAERGRRPGRRPSGEDEAH